MINLLTLSVNKPAISSFLATSPALKRHCSKMKGKAKIPTNGHPRTGPRQKKKVARHARVIPKGLLDARGRAKVNASMVVYIAKVDGRKAGPTPSPGSAIDRHHDEQRRKLTAAGVPHPTAPEEHHQTIPPHPLVDVVRDGPIKASLTDRTDDP